MASITDVQGSSAQVSLQPHADTVDYWTTLIRNNIAKLKYAHDSESDDTQELDIDEEILNAPRRKSTRDALARSIASYLYPAPASDSLAPIIAYEKDIVTLRGLVLDQRRTAIATATERNAKVDWTKRISKQGPWNEEEDPLPLNGAPSLPMPVEVSDKESLAPFFAHLRNNGTHEPSSAQTCGGFITGTEPFYHTEIIEFEKGVLYADGRLDLCKMVTGPRNIGDLMQALRTNAFSKHFLLGNNIIGRKGAQEIAAFIEDYPDRFETWYLAGNCIDASGFSSLVTSMVKSKVITNVWLKRNPLGIASSKDIFRLITGSAQLRTLDLDQTELGDEGVAELFDSLATYDKPLSLRHIYLNAVGIGAHACAAIARYLASSHCDLHSLYMSNNPVGDAGADALATGIVANRSLKRISLQSCGLKNVGVLLQALIKQSNIEMLDLGQSYATEDLGMRYNWLAESSTDHLFELVASSNKLRYLNLSYVPILQAHVNKLLETIATHSTSLLWFYVRPLVTGGTDVASVKAGQKYVRLSKLVRERLHLNVKEAYGEAVDYQRFENEHKRFLVSPKDVRLIDSVYRNRDAGMARRGLKRLEKWWDEGDETLAQVKEGTFV